MKNFSSIFFTIFFFSCTGSLPETFFEKDGISFISPEGWRITDERSIKESGYFVSCKRIGYRSGGVFMVSWLNGIIGSDKYIQRYTEEFEKNVLMKTATIQFTEPRDSFFNEMPCSVSEYRAKILGVSSRGEIYSFHCGSRTFMLVFQESVGESGTNKAGFEKIKSTFKCKSEKNLSVNNAPCPTPHAPQILSQIKMRNQVFLQLLVIIHDG
jgi:hypothetical protein